MFEECVAFPEDVVCPYCGDKVGVEPFWQGIHSCVRGRCSHCDVTMVADLPVGQALYTPYMVALERDQIFGDQRCLGWFGQPLLNSLLQPDHRSVDLVVEKRKTVDRMIILNCLDYLYGHSLLKLLNADRHLREDVAWGLVVIVPKLLRWMVPDGVAEIWSVSLSLEELRSFFPDLHRRIHRECLRFSEVRLSPAYSHPDDFDIVRFSGVPQHDFSKDDFRVTFIWRSDRLWVGTSIVYRVLCRVKMRFMFLWWQKMKVILLFQRLKQLLKGARFTVAGVGRAGNFPSWIDDQRIEPPLAGEQEAQLCRVYSESRVAIGVHGSNMLLPSAHAGMVVDLMPRGRWGNMIQDILYHEPDPRSAAYLCRYLPLETGLAVLVEIISTQLKDYCGFMKRMRRDASRNNKGVQYAA